MHRLIFWGIIILIVLVIGLVIDQIFYRTMRIFFEKPTAQTIRLWVFVATVFIIVGNGLWGHYITRVRLNINNVEIHSPRVPKSFEGFRIAHISDFHIDSFDDETGHRFVEEIVEKIIAEKPDIVCFTGDIVTTRAAQLIPFRQTLAKIPAAGIPVYSVMGNHDYADYVWDFDEERRQRDRDTLRMIQKEMGWQMLDNDYVKIQRGEDSIFVVGVENIGEPPFTVYGDLKASLPSVPSPPNGERGSGQFKVLLSHNPSHWRREVLPETDIDLMLAGHTHSMQFSIFGWSPSKYSYHEYSGLYQEGEQYLYVNTGLGCTGPKIRINVRPELTILKLTGSN